MTDFYHVSKRIISILFRSLTRWQVRGKENVPDQGPLLIVANHINLVDPLLIGVSFDRKVRYMAKDELFHPRFLFLGRLIRSYGAFPVHRGRLNREVLRRAGQVLADGHPLLVFPEGRRSKNTRLQSASSGSALIASRNGAPVLPVGVAGTEKIKGVAWIFSRPRVTVNIGQPFYLPSVDGKLTKEKLAELTDSIMQHIAELLPLEYRGKYSGDGNQGKLTQI